MPEINLFNGGINTLKDQRKLEPNEMVQVYNADISSGSIRSIVTPRVTKYGVGEVFTEYKGKLVSGKGKYLQYTEMNNNLYKSDGLHAEYSPNKRDLQGNLIWYDIGLETPEVTQEVYSESTKVFNFNDSPEALNSVEVTVKPLPEFIGATEKRSYNYLFLVDGVPFTFTYDCLEEGRALSFNLSRVKNANGGTPGTITTYRYVNGFVFLSNSLTFDDFSVSKTKQTYLTREYNIQIKDQFYRYCVNPGTRIEWLGNGTAKFRGKANCSEDALAPWRTINFITGEYDKKGSLMEGTKWSHTTTTCENMEWVGGFAEFTLRVTYLQSPKTYTIRVGKDFYRVDDTPINFLDPREIDFGVEATYMNSLGENLDFTKPPYETTMMGEFEYRLTVTDINGVESSGASFVTGVVSSGEAVKVTIPAIPNPEGLLVSVNLYRKSTYQGVGYNYLFVESFAPGVSHEYIDTKKVTELGGLIPTQTLIKAPLDMLYLTEFRGRLFGATKDVEQATQDYEDYLTVRYSDLGAPNKWDALSFIVMPKPITGFGKTANGLVIFGYTTCHILSGTDTESFSMKLISASHGCIDHRSIQNWQDTTICASKDGLIMTDGGSVQLVSYPKLGIMSLENKILSSTIVGNSYFLLDVYGNILRYDITGGYFVYLKFDKAVSLGTIDGELYMVDSSGVMYLSEFDRLGKAQYKILTGQIVDGAVSMLKEYDKVRVSTEGTGTVSIFLDGKTVISNAKLTSGVTQIGIPNEKNKGYSIQFDVTGVGALHAIEYKVGGRENG